MMARKKALTGTALQRRQGEKTQAPGQAKIRCPAGVGGATHNAAREGAA
jgi:hypothetical protein